MKRVCSIFSQILQLIPRDSFEAAVRKHQAERHARGFSSWGQAVAMLFCQLAQAKSLREIREGLQACEGKLKHLGLPEAPARSTLAYANSHRPWQLFETVFQQLLTRCQQRLGVAKAGARLGLPGKLLSLGATVIDLCAAVFDLAQFRTTKGAVKLHLLLDHDGYLPCYAVITEGKVHEIQVARKLKLQRGTMLVFDRGYTDYDWFQRLTEEGVHFVTRLKDNATYRLQGNLACNCRNFTASNAISAVQICVFSALAVVPTNVLTRRFCFRALNSSSICQRSL